MLPNAAPFADQCRSIKKTPVIIGLPVSLLGVEKIMKNTPAVIKAFERQCSPYSKPTEIRKEKVPLNEFTFIL